MSFGNIIGGLLQQGLGGSAERRLRTGAGEADRSGGGLDRTLQQLLSRSGRGGAGGGTGGDDLVRMARDFLGQKQAGGMSGAQIGGLGALVGGLFGGGGIRGAAKGGAMALLGTLALKAWREHQAQQAGPQGAGQPAGEAGAPPLLEPTPDEADALTDPRTERLVLRAMIGAAQADGRIDGAEMDRILGRMGEDGMTEEERREAQAEASRPVDVEALAREVSRPEVAAEVYLGALLAVEIDTEAERDYLRRLASALSLEPGMIRRLHRMTGAPEP